MDGLLSSGPDDKDLLGSSEGPPPATRVEWVARRLREAIIRGVFKPGERLLHNDVAERLAVSQTPLREAIQRLAAERFIEVSPQRGSRVAPIDLGEIHEVLQLRLTLEPVALRLSLDRADERLDALVRRRFRAFEETAETGDPYLVEVEHARRDLHGALVSRCPSGWLSRTLALLSDHALRYAIAGAGGPRGDPLRLIEERELVDAVVARDAEGVTRLRVAALERQLRHVDSRLEDADVPRWIGTNTAEEALTVNRYLPAWFEPGRWVPPPDSVEARLVKQFMDREGLSDYQALLERSAADPDWFYRNAFEHLALEWPLPFTTTVDETAGQPWARWFVGGRTNVAHLSVERWRTGPRAAQPAIMWESEDGRVEELSFAELGTQVDGLAAGLLDLGIVRGDRVCLYMPMIPEAAVALLAVARIGAIAVLAFSGYGAGALAERLGRSEAKLVITADGFVRRGTRIEMKSTVDAALADTEQLAQTVVVQHAGGDVAMGERDVWWNELLGEPRAVPPLEQFEADTPFLLAFTSGSSGRPKGAVHTHGGFPYRLATEVSYLEDVHPGDRVLRVSDLGWIIGPVSIIGSLSVGATCVMIEGAVDTPEPDRLWRTIDRLGVTHLALTPTIVRIMAAYGQDWVDRHELSTLRVLMSTGEPMTPRVWRWLHRHVGRGLLPIINVSGGTEVGCSLLACSPVEPLIECAFSGPPPGMDVDVVDALGRTLTGKEGELVARRSWPSMTKGFWQEPQRYLDSYWSRWPDVWVHGDRAVREADGTWRLPGRSDDLIKVAGKRVGPAEYESLAEEVKGVEMALAVGVPDPVKGEAVVVVVQPVAGVGGETLIESVETRVAAGLGKAMRPVAVLAVAELPMTTAGKVHRRAARTWLAGTATGDLSTLVNPRSRQLLLDAWHLQRETADV